MKGKSPTQNQRKKGIEAPYCCYTQRPAPQQLTANTAGCPSSLGARFDQETSRDHPPISFQSHSALGQQPWYLEMLCRCLLDAKLLNNLWGIFPLEQKQTLLLTGDPAFPREAAVIYMCIQILCFPSCSKSCCYIPAAKGLQYLAIEVTHLVQGDVLCTTVEFNHLFIRHRFEPSRHKTTQFVNNHQSAQCY